VHADPLLDLRVNHYVDAIGRRRCGPQLCNTRDESAAWAIALLQERRRQAEQETAARNATGS